jgi:hypothetical protein
MYRICFLRVKARAGAGTKILWLRNSNVQHMKDSQLNSFEKINRDLDYFDAGLGWEEIGSFGMELACKASTLRAIRIGLRSGEGF